MTTLGMVVKELHDENKLLKAALIEACKYIEHGGSEWCQSRDADYYYKLFTECAKAQLENDR